MIDADGGLHAASPCTHVYLGYQPGSPRADTWTISLDGTARQPGWRARFDRHACRGDPRLTAHPRGAPGPLSPCPSRRPCPRSMGTAPC
ncbi:DUF317 domain-containing protein [Peterkaempfera bronchialis]|uniref:DUF317 domain-containing protein n=1 Tax=Peterkaempfera bronchialis TaxID=2126346 RepID=UPI003C2E3904